LASLPPGPLRREGHPPQRRALVVHEAPGQHQRGAAQDALGEGAEEQEVAQGIADAHHDHQPQPGQQEHRGEDQLVPFEATHAPDEVDDGEGGEEEPSPKEELGPEPSRLADDEPRLEPPDLRPGEEGNLRRALAPGFQALLQGLELGVPLDLGGGDADAGELADVGEPALVRPLPDLLGRERPLRRALEDVVQEGEELFRPP
jgi:hypothetical protein